ncbi:C4-type zinc ribbon domain-containing protein [soil metagenome]
MALKASPDDQALLLDLQALDTKLAQLDHRARSIPELATLTTLGSQSETVRITLAEQSGVAEDIAIELKRVESDVEIVETRITRDSERLQASSSVKDVAALEQELGSLKKRLGDLEEIELTVMERAEEQQATVASTKAELDALAAKIAEAETARDAALATIAGERATAAAGRRTIEGKVPAELLALYEKQRTRYGTGASLLRGGVSLASGVKLLEDELQKIRAAAPDDVLICPSSDAILVRTEESGL